MQVIRRPLRVLMVEDSPADAALTVRSLQRGGYDVAWERVDSEPGMREALQRDSWDAILCDYTIPGFGALPALQLAQGLEIDLPFIIVTGSRGEEHAAATMRAGAHDFILKDHLSRLVPALERELEEAEVRRERMKAEARIRYLAYHDPFTGLPNYIAFLEGVDARLSQESKGPVAVCVIHPANYQEIMATLGRDNAGTAMTRLAERLSALAGPDAVVGYLGGRQFALARASGGNATIAAEIREIQAAMQGPMEVANLKLHVPIHMGLSFHPDHGADARVLVHRAQVALSLVPGSGGTWLAYAPERDPYDPQRLALLGDLRIALERNELVPYFQPKVVLATSRLAGVEALVRWRHPERGFVPPDQFIAAAEKSGLIGLLTRNILRQVVGQARQWRARGWTLPVALNLSTKDLLDQAVMDEIMAISDEDCASLELEITESALMEDPARALEALLALRRRGMHVFIDDFGTGYSSLAYLKRLPVQAIKIDKSFVADMLTSASARMIVNSTIALAHGLGLEVVAEGVEDEPTLEALNEAGCDEAQGYFISRPIPAQNLEQWITASRWKLGAEEGKAGPAAGN